jgi:hypothetical protein
MLPGRDATPVALKLLLNKYFQACFCREAHPPLKLLFLVEKLILLRAHVSARSILSHSCCCQDKLILICQEEMLLLSLSCCYWTKCFQACFCRKAHPPPKLLLLVEKLILLRAHATARTRSYNLAHASTRISSSSSQAQAFSRTRSYTPIVHACLRISSYASQAHSSPDQDIFVVFLQK